MGSGGGVGGNDRDDEVTLAGRREALEFALKPVLVQVEKARGLAAFQQVRGLEVLLRVTEFGQPEEMRRKTQSKEVRTPQHQRQACPTAINQEAQRSASIFERSPPERPGDFTRDLAQERKDATERPIGLARYFAQEREAAPERPGDLASQLA